MVDWFMVPRRDVDFFELEATRIIRGASKYEWAQYIVRIYV
jgi:hypothetical protein